MQYVRIYLYFNLAYIIGVHCFFFIFFKISATSIDKFKIYSSLVFGYMNGNISCHLFWELGIGKEIMLFVITGVISVVFLHLILNVCLGTIRMKEIFKLKSKFFKTNK